MAMCSYTAAFERNRRLPLVPGPSVGPAMSMEVCTHGTGASSLPLRTRPGEVRWGGHGSPWWCAKQLGWGGWGCADPSCLKDSP